MHTHDHFPALWILSGIPGWASNRRNIHPVIPIVVISHPLSASSIYYDPWHHPCSIYVLGSLFHNLSPSFLWSTSWPGILHFILHTFLHPIIVFFSQHMPIPCNLFCCSTENSYKHQKYQNQPCNLRKKDRKLRTLTHSLQRDQWPQHISAIAALENRLTTQLANWSWANVNFCWWNINPI